MLPKRPGGFGGKRREGAKKSSRVVGLNRARYRKGCRLFEQRRTSRLLRALDGSTLAGGCIRGNSPVGYGRRGSGEDKSCRTMLVDGGQTTFCGGMGGAQ